MQSPPFAWKTGKFHSLPPKFGSRPWKTESRGHGYPQSQSQWDLNSQRNGCLGNECKGEWDYVEDFCKQTSECNCTECTRLNSAMLYRLLLFLAQIFRTFLAINVKGLVLQLSVNWMWIECALKLVGLSLQKRQKIVHVTDTDTDPNTEYTLFMAYCQVSTRAQSLSLCVSLVSLPSVILPWLRVVCYTAESEYMLAWIHWCSSSFASLPCELSNRIPAQQKKICTAPAPVYLVHIQHTQRSTISTPKNNQKK